MSGTIRSAQGNSYEDPRPPDSMPRGIAKAYLKGWICGIWSETPTAPYRYSRQGFRFAFERGFKEAIEARREQGEPV
jgi:hypothetical protein